MTTCRPVCEYSALVTRQFTGEALEPSNRFVRTVSITVPSSTGCRGPAALIGGVWSGTRRDSDENGDDGKGVGACCRIWDAELDVRPVVRVVALTTASATSSTDGLAPSARPGAVDCDVLRPTSGRSFSGRRLRTTLLAKRLSYSRRFRSVAIGSCGGGACESSYGACWTFGAGVANWASRIACASSRRSLSW